MRLTEAKYCHTIQKITQKWGFKDPACVGSEEGMIYDFHIYCGKDDAELDLKICRNFHTLLLNFQSIFIIKGNINCILIIGSQHYHCYIFLKSKQVCAVGTIRANRLPDCPLAANKHLKRQGRGALDYRVDSNSCIIAAKWVDNKTVEVASNYIGIEPMGTIKQWSKALNAYKNIPCLQIILAYNKSMGGVDLVDMLIA